MNMHISILNNCMVTMLENKYISNITKEEKLDWSSIYEILGILSEQSVKIKTKFYVLDYLIKNYPYGFDEILRTIMDIEDEQQKNSLLEKYILNSVNDQSIATFCKVVGYLNIDMPKSIMKIVHDKYGMIFFNNKKRKPFCVESYCYTFRNCLTNFEKETFVNILINILKDGYIEKAIHKIKFNDEQMSRLNSQLVLYQLAQNS